MSGAEPDITNADAHEPPDSAAQRQSLARLREKLRVKGARAGRDGHYTDADLVQLNHALAERKLEDQLRDDYGNRERLAEAHLEAPWQEIAACNEDITDPLIKPILQVIGSQLAEHSSVEFAGASPESPPSWERFELGDEVIRVPKWMTIYWDAGTVAAVPLVLETFAKQHGQFQVVQVFSRPEDHTDAKKYLDQLMDDAKGRRSPYRGRLLKASWGQRGIDLDVLPAPTEHRENLVLPASTWEALDSNVRRMFERMPILRQAGLGSNRGVLLAGPPGTGKTASCRVLASELVGSVTALFVDAAVAASLLPSLYTEISGLVPAIVFLEDLDLLVGDRERRSARNALFDFLTVLDGLMTQHHEVVTVATTNDPAAIDAGVRRAARFDRIIYFEVPELLAREQILANYLQSVDHQVDVPRVARATDGMTGADLRECIRSAVLNADHTVSTDDVLNAARGLAVQEPTELAPSGTEGRYL